MTPLASTAPQWLAALRANTSALPQSPLSWLNERRARALERANALSVPTPRDEDWRFTDLAPLRQFSLQHVSAAHPLAEADIAPFNVPEVGARLVFVDGRFLPSLSNGTSAAVTTLAEGLKTHGALLQQHLGAYAAFEQQVFPALNTAWLRDGALVVLGANAALDKPVHVLFVTTQPDAATCPRVLVIAESGARCALIEDYVTLTDGAYLTNTVCEVAVAANAEVRHVRLQRESPAAAHIATTAVSLAKDAHFRSQSVALGARLSRVNLDIRQAGEGAQIDLDGLALIGGEQLADTHSSIDHAFAHGRCTQMHKTIVGGAAHAVFNGKVLVREGAQLTNSAQQSRNLLLSPRARVDTKPQLEIFADDVKCAHGATVGQLDAEQLFYLKSRGLPEQQARNLLTYAFGAEVIQRIPVPSLVNQLQQAVLARVDAK
jgi:Fe-S cluster assembly protein SufD